MVGLGDFEGLFHNDDPVGSPQDQTLLTVQAALVQKHRE